MTARHVRVERRVRVVLGGEFVLSVELPPSADRFDVARAAVELDRLAPLLAEVCDGCGTPRGFVHHPECPHVAHRDFVEELRAEMELDLGSRR